ncbi:MAG TPA: hypothetical protein PK948_02965 [Gemmatimonadales bacterium]|nr:hypothetical protein [Gemmatimonadales bacterium]
MPRLSAVLSLLIAVAPGATGSLAAQAAGNEALIKSALAAAPAEIAKGAAVVAPGPDGKMVQLKAGTNGFTCLPDQPETPGKDAMCLDPQGMIWAQSWMAHDPKPKNTAPGIVYMLAGGSDISANDPWAKIVPGQKFIESPPHYMVMWPFDAKTTGLSTTPSKTGSWIMFAGTPYAHLMINQVP